MTPALMTALCVSFSKITTNVSSHEPFIPKVNDSPKNKISAGRGEVGERGSMWKPLVSVLNG
jgi:hypothetical protein